MQCFPHTGRPSTNRILPTGQDLLHIPQEIQPSSTWKPLATNDETYKQRIHDIRFQPGSTALMHVPSLLPCNDIFDNRSNGMPCILYLLTAKRLIVQVEHRYVGIRHCNRPSCIQRKMLRQRFIPFPISSPHVHTA